MSSFKEIKKREKVKTWESKIRRLYACENLSDDDLKFLNIQYNMYDIRKSNTYLWGIASSALIYRFPMVNELHWTKRYFISLTFGYLIYRNLRAKNKLHYEALIYPYFEKYYIK